MARVGADERRAHRGACRRGPRPLVSPHYRVRRAAARVEAAEAVRRPRPLVSSAYQARMAAATAAADQATARAGGTPARPKEAVGEHRWQGRPLLGTSVRLLAMAVPVTAAVVSAVVFSRLITRPLGTWEVVGWFALVTGVSTFVLVAVDRVARRLLPLAALLRLSMAFPDRAPSRFSVAFKAGTTRNLKAQLESAKAHAIRDELSQSAERILTLVGAMSSHDRGTRGHSERVRAFNDLISEEMRLSQPDRDRLRWAALLHDVGKLHVPTRILNKPGKPSVQEWAQLRRHPEEGARIAAPLAGWLGPWAAAIDQHHERWDGGGYPKGLRSEDISLAARIVAVADTFEVITAPRPYKRPVNAQAAREELARCAGTHFDPAVVRALLNVSIGRLRLAMGPVSWLAQLPFLGSVPRLEGLALAAGRSAATAAGTATGVGALVLAGVMVPASTASSNGDEGPVSQDAARGTEPAKGVLPSSTSTGSVGSPPAAAPVLPGSAEAAKPSTFTGPDTRNPVSAEAGNEPPTQRSAAPRSEPASGPEPSPSRTRETRKEFDARQRAERKAFDARQRDQRKSFDHRQPKSAKEAFERRQEAEKAEFEARQRAERDAFDAGEGRKGD